MVGRVIPCRPGQMTHLTQEHYYTSILCFEENVFFSLIKTQYETISIEHMASFLVYILLYSHI